MSKGMTVFTFSLGDRVNIHHKRKNICIHTKVIYKFEVKELLL